MYKPIGWKNRAVEYARRYEMTQGERSGLVYLKPAPGEVDNQGTPVNAENLNHMDEGILNLDQNKVNATDGDVSDTIATFDQNPTTAPENIASGDRLGTLFGKIYNVIKDFSVTNQTRRYTQHRLKRIAGAILSAMLKPMQMRCIAS